MISKRKVEYWRIMENVTDLTKTIQSRPWKCSSSLGILMGRQASLLEVQQLMDASTGGRKSESERYIDEYAVRSTDIQAD